MMNEPNYWQAVLQKNQDYDGFFVYAVQTTGVYCRPSCSSRKPKREHVSFYSLPEVAEQAGFRACKRCRPDQAAAPDPQVELVREICRFIEAHLEDSLALDALAGQFGLSPSHLQRTFKRLAGISPKQYAEACRIKKVKAALNQGDGIMDALFDAGYNSSSRLYSKASAQLGMTPKAYQQGGEGAQIRYTIVPCSLGYLLVAATAVGICMVQIGDNEIELQESLAAALAGATASRDDSELSGWVNEILNHLNGQQPHLDLPLDVQATAFQRRVWQALQEIPYGRTRTYAEVAQAIGQPTATRAVARACATNPVALVIPCHRVVRTDGSLGGYRWGILRKRALLERESAADAQIE